MDIKLALQHQYYDDEHLSALKLVPTAACLKEMNRCHYYLNDQEDGILVSQRLPADLEQRLAKCSNTGKNQHKNPKIDSNTEHPDNPNNSSRNLSFIRKIVKVLEFHIVCEQDDLFLISDLDDIMPSRSLIDQGLAEKQIYFIHAKYEDPNSADGQEDMQLEEDDIRQIIFANDADERRISVRLSTLPAKSLSELSQWAKFVEPQQDTTVLPSLAADEADLNTQLVDKARANKHLPLNVFTMCWRHKLQAEMPTVEVQRLSALASQVKARGLYNGFRVVAKAPPQNTPVDSSSPLAFDPMLSEQIKEWSLNDLNKKGNLNAARRLARKLPEDRDNTLIISDSNHNQCFKGSQDDLSILGRALSGLPPAVYQIAIGKSNQWFYWPGLNLYDKLPLAYVRLETSELLAKIEELRCLLTDSEDNPAQLLDETKLTIKINSRKTIWRYRILKRTPALIPDEKDAEKKVLSIIDSKQEVQSELEDSNNSITFVQVQPKEPVFSDTPNGYVEYRFFSSHLIPLKQKSFDGIQLTIHDNSYLGNKKHLLPTPKSTQLRPINNQDKQLLLALSGSVSYSEVELETTMLNEVIYYL